MSEEIVWEKRNRVRILTLNRPDALNALSLSMMQREAECLEEFQNDDDARVLIYQGSGRAFSTGLDLTAAREILALPPEKRPRTLTAPDAPEIWKPVIAAINGYALGGGCELALACDIRLAADDARIGLPEVKRALIPGAGGCQRLPRLIGLGNAFLMLLTGDWIDAQEAYRVGLVQKVVPRDRLLDEAVALAEKICESGPVAVRLVKETVLRGREMSLRNALAQDRLMSMRNRQTAPEDVDEGIKAFREKRPPVYKGR
jgi:enoyl-CoA hydratase/carnithine racemase